MIFRANIGVVAEPDDLPDRMIRALAIQMLRSGVLSPEDIVAASSDADAGGDPVLAHELKCLIAEAAAPSTTEWEADRRRARMRVVASDGGNPQPE